jgi:ribosomal silencing factor RsfS
VQLQYELLYRLPTAADSTEISTLGNQQQHLHHIALLRKIREQANNEGNMFLEVEKLMVSQWLTLSCNV